MRRVCAILASSLLLACSDTANPNDPNPNDPGTSNSVTQVSVSAAATTLAALGATTQVTATPKNASGAVVAGVSVTFVSSDATVATVNASGLVTAAKNGAVTITATASGKSGTVNITVAQVVTSVAISPTTGPTLSAIGDTTTLTATARDSRNNLVPGVTMTWSSATTGVATVSNGKVTAVSNGTSMITASAPGNIKDTKTVTVSQAVASVVITPGSLASFDATGATAALSAVARDSKNNTVAGAPITWATSAGSVATVSTGGTVTSVANGTARITAASSGKLDTVNVTVSQVATSVDLTCVSYTALSSWGATRQCNAEVWDRLNHVMAGTVVWSSSTPNVLTVSATGLLTAKNNGGSFISATFGALSDSQFMDADFKLPYGSVVQGNIDGAGYGQTWDVTGGGSTTALVTWMTRDPLGSGSLDPHIYLSNFSLGVRNGVSTGRMTVGAEMLARASFPNSSSTDIVAQGDGSTSGGYVLALTDCRVPFGTFAPGQYNWTALQSTDCAVLNGPSSGSSPILTNAVIARIDLTAGQNVTIEIAKGCSPAAANLGCTGSAGTLDPYLYLFGPNNAQAYFDDDGGSGTNSSLALAVPTTGVYTAVITTFGAGQLGQFTFCTFSGCSSYAGAPPSNGAAPFAVSGPGPTPPGWSSHLTVDMAYQRLRAMGLIQDGFSPRSVWQDK